METSQTQTQPIRRSLPQRYAELEPAEKNRVIQLMVDYTDEPESLVMKWVHGEEEPGEVDQCMIAIIFRVPRHLIFKPLNHK